MIKILFICHGNICRSPMAEFMLKNIAMKYGLSSNLEISSAATSSEELGNDMYYPAKKILRDNGIPFEPRCARKVCLQDYEYYDKIIGMDNNNIRNLKNFFGGDPQQKISMLLDRPVADPWYSGDFEATYNDLLEGIEKLIAELSHSLC